jgi:CRISPR-associated endonuclease/helicase Cas3
MNALSHAEFASFFFAVWGFDPFPWQVDLLQRFATGKDPRRNHDGAPGAWPDVLDLPTGAGKTAALDIAVFHLALEAGKKEQRRAPVRIAFVVDRRLIVDDAYARANRLSNVLGWSLLSEVRANQLEAELAERDPHAAEVFRRVRRADVMKRVALCLCELAGAGEPPLVARPLRGGVPREDDWARTPVQPTILCSTIDQVGSRLLFRGYGLNDRTKPIHAGLLGSDCLLLLDEAHLSEPFRQTLTAVERLRTPDRAPFGFAVLTATPSKNRDARNSKARFSLSPADEVHPILSRRITATKPTRLIEITGKQGVDTESRRAEVVAERTRLLLGSLQAAGVAYPAIGVVVNRVARARAAFERLQSELKDSAEVILLIGPARVVDRDALARELDPIRTRHPDARRQLPKPFIVVATQTIEAGVDIDFDGLVTEAAAFDALKQRFGRLNRAGRSIKSEAVILAHKDDVGNKVDDPVYGDRIKATWEELQRLTAESDGVADFRLDALRNRIDKEKAGTLVAPTEDAPVLMPAYADLWSQTSPIPNADPEVALFLHGPDRAGARVQIVWRADIDQQNDLRPAMGEDAATKAERARLIELFKLVPPRAAEAVEVPLWAARAWLERSSTNPADFSDTAERTEAAEERRAGRRAFRWAGADSERSRVILASELRNGDLIVVPADYGGCDQWGWNPRSSETVIDVADEAARPYRARRFAVRVTPALVVQAQEPTAVVTSLDRSVIADALGGTLAQHEGDGSPDGVLTAILGLRVLASTLKRRLESLQRNIPQASNQERRKGNLDTEFDLYGRDAEGHPRGIVFAARRGLHTLHGDGTEAGASATESDDLGAIADRAISLADHSRHVRDWARAFAERSGLPPALHEDIGLSAYLHDLH